MVDITDLLFIAEVSAGVVFGLIVDRCLKGHYAKA